MQQNPPIQLRRFHRPQTRNNQENKYQEAQSIRILSDDNCASNQMIIVYLSPYTMIWYKGQIFSSSHGIMKQKNNQQFVHLLSDSWKLGTLAPRNLQNLSSDTCYYVIKKQTGKDGKILIINEDVYNQDFYVNFDKLLTVNLDIHQYDIQRHSQIKYLRSIFPKKTIPVPLVMTLQSMRDNTIIEKYLANNQKMYIPNASIVAMGSKVTVTKSKAKQLILSGPGFVFFQPQSRYNVHPKLYEYLSIVFFLLLLILVSDLI